MLKMEIQMNTDKIIFEKKYQLDGIYKTIDAIFEQLGFSHAQNEHSALVYRGSGHVKDYGRFGKIVNKLKKQGWFMDNVSVWRLYNSDDSDNPMDFSEEDLLAHYRNTHRSEV